MKQINNNIKETLISFQVAKLLKEAGFKVKCTCVFHLLDETDDEWFEQNLPNEDWNQYETHYSRPTQQLVIDWLRINFNIQINAQINKLNGAVYTIYSEDEINEVPSDLKRFETIEEAKEAAILFTLTNLM